MELKDNDLLFAKVKPDAIIPSKDEENAGYDLYACFEDDYILIDTAMTKLIPTGIATAMTSKWYGQIEERGSTGSKGIKKSAGVIDSGFRGEIFVAITNCSYMPIIISKLSLEELTANSGWEEDEFIFYPYSKAIAQMVIHEVPKMNKKEVSYEELLTIKSKRGTGMLGSSQK